MKEKSFENFVVSAAVCQEISSLLEKTLSELINIQAKYNDSMSAIIMTFQSEFTKYSGCFVFADGVDTGYAKCVEDLLKGDYKNDADN